MKFAMGTTNDDIIDLIIQNEERREFANTIPNINLVSRLYPFCVFQEIFDFQGKYTATGIVCSHSRDVVHHIIPVYSRRFLYILIF